MHILGISTLGRGSAVALLNETSVLFAIEEEKLCHTQPHKNAILSPRLLWAKDLNLKCLEN